MSRCTEKVTPSLQFNQLGIVFYENLSLYLVLTRDFKGFYDKFLILRRYYTELWEPIEKKSYVSEKSIKIVVLMLLYLNIENQSREFEVMYQALNPEVKQLEELKQLERFIEFVSIGNYNNALEIYSSASIEFRNLMERIMEIKKYE